MFGDKNKNLVLFLAVSAFAVSIAAVYGALVNGDLFLHGSLFSSDRVAPFVMWQDVRAGIFSYADWNFQRISVPYLFTDHPIMWGLYWITGGNVAAGTHLFGALMMSLNTLVWVVISDFLYGKETEKRAVLIILGALTGIVIAYGGYAVLGDFIAPASHSSTWVVAGFCVWTFIFASRSRRIPLSVFLFVLCLAGVSSDPILTIWFVAPATVAGILCAALFRTVAPVFPSVAAISGFLLAPFVRDYFIEEGKGTIQVSGFGTWERIFASLRDMGTWWAEAVDRHPLLAVAWVLFFVFLLIAIVRGVRSVKNTKPERMFVLLFLFFAPAASVGAAVLSGNYSIESSPESLGSARYFFPARIVPLFVGWAFLSAGRIPLSLRMLAIAAVALVAACMPHVLALKQNGMSLVRYYPPEAQCFDKAARRFGLKKGLATYWWTKSIMATSKTGVQIAQVSVYPGPDGGKRLYAWKFGIPNRFYKGPFDFVIVNNSKGLPSQEGTCTDPEKCRVLSSTRDPLSTYILTPDSIQNREPYSVFQCEGIEEMKILVYRPPL